MEQFKAKEYILIIIAIVLLCGGAIYYFGIKKSENISFSENKIENSNTSDEIKKKELELKERELNLKEKELKNQNSSNFSGFFSESSLKNFVNDWVGYQNNKNYPAYINCYSVDFNGVKRTKSGKTTNYNYSQWTEDRVKMYSSAKNLSIWIDEIEVKQLDNTNKTATVIFVQYYISDKYSDKGKKMLKIKNENSSFKIYYEELFYSTDSIDNDVVEEGD
ncbi:MAG: hypothetical protein K1X86_16145 [Ignavibacteria bacterium]|nr:hypothetical protein [Ignavibacteria bacterium]